MEYDLDLDLVDEEDPPESGNTLDDVIEDKWQKSREHSTTAQAGDASAAPQDQPQQQQPQHQQPEPNNNNN